MNASEYPESSNHRSAEELAQSEINQSLKRQSAELLEAPDLCVLTRKLARFYSETEPELFTDIVMAAEAVDSSDDDPEHHAAHAFTLGAVLGAHMAKSLLLEESEYLRYGLASMNMRLGQPDVSADQGAFGIMEYAGEGMRRAEAAEELLEQAEMQACPDVTRQVYFRGGFGYVMYVASRLMADIEARKQEEVMADLQGSLDAGIDWDGAFQRFTQGNDSAK